MLLEPLLMTMSFGAFGGAYGSNTGDSSLAASHHTDTLDAMETYFECITTCSLDDGACVTACVERLRESA
jgi:hypothetical protein